MECWVSLDQSSQFPLVSAIAECILRCTGLLPYLWLACPNRSVHLNKKSWCFNIWLDDDCYNLVMIFYWTPLELIWLYFIHFFRFSFCFTDANPIFYYFYILYYFIPVSPSRFYFLTPFCFIVETWKWIVVIETDWDFSSSLYHTFLHIYILWTPRLSFTSSLFLWIILLSLHTSSGKLHKPEFSETLPSSSSH